MIFMAKIKKGRNLGQVPLSEQRPDTPQINSLTSYEFYLKYERKEGEPVLSQKDFYASVLGNVSTQLANSII